MSAEAVLSTVRTDTGSVRRNLLLVALATLPFTYALTLDLSFPVKIYEVALAMVLVTYLRDLRLPLAPDSIVPLHWLAWFVTGAAIVTLMRFALPAEGASSAEFGARFGPTGDAVAKILYLVLGILGFLLFARIAYADERGFLRAWRIGATAAAVYSWYLFAAGLLGFEPLLLPGIAVPTYFTVAGRTFIRSGTFQEGNFLGLFLLISVGIALYERKRLLAVLFSVTLLLTFSTVGVLALALFWLMVWWRSHPRLSLARKTLYVAAGVTVMLAVALVLWHTGYLESVVLGKLSGDELGSRVKRIAFVLAGFRMFADHPLLGVGISQFGYFYNSYQPLGILGIAQTVKLIPNNIYIELLSELGILGFLLFAGFLVSVYARLLRPQLAPLRWTFLAVLFALNAFPTYTVMFLWAFFGLAVGASSRLGQIPTSESAA